MLIRTLASLLVLIAAPAAAQTTILPGYWESSSQSTFLLESPVKVQRTCITPEQVETYLSGPSTRHYTCVYAARSVAHGRAAFQGTCTDKHGQSYAVNIKGTYGPEHFHMDAEFSVPKLPIGGTATTDAHRIAAECPAS